MVMSALGQKQTFSDVPPMSALPPKADILGPGSGAQISLALLQILFDPVYCFACLGVAISLVVGSPAR
jgi:hypothetical protein